MSSALEPAATRYSGARHITASYHVTSKQRCVVAEEAFLLYFKAKIIASQCCKKVSPHSCSRRSPLTQNVFPTRHIDVGLVDDLPSAWSVALTIKPAAAFATFFEFAPALSEIGVDRNFSGCRPSLLLPRSSGIVTAGCFIHRFRLHLGMFLLLSARQDSHRFLPDNQIGSFLIRWAGSYSFPIVAVPAQSPLP
jgi:hypothetical protein